MARKTGKDEFPPCDPATVAPLDKDGQPNLYDYVPTRYVSQAEAKHRGWRYFWEGKICKYHHTAARYTSNHYQCVDCARAKEGQQPVYPKAPGEPPYAARAHKQPTPAAPSGAAVVPVVKAPEPTKLEKEFLAIYADVRDFDKAAKMVGVSPAHLQGTMAWSAVFREAVENLEKANGIPRSIPLSGPYEWNDDLRFRYIEVWINTGEEATARDAIRVTPAEFYREQERNSEFAAHLEKARPLAIRALRERAIQLSLLGNDKLLAIVLKAELPETYSERVKLDVNVNERKSNEQLATRLFALLTDVAKRRGIVLEGEFSEVAPRPALEASRDGRGDGEEGQPQSIRDLL